MVRSNSEENESTQRTTSGGGQSPLSAYVNSMNDGSHRRGSSFSVSAWEVLGAVSTFRHNLDRLRWYKSSISTIKFLSILNITYTVVGIIFLMLSIMPAFDMKFTELQRDNFFILGIAISIFSPVALITDLLALKGLRSWKRSYLIPWLILYGIVIALVFAVAITQLYHFGIQWPMLLLAFCSLLVFSRWRHLSLQYKLMGIYPERPSERNIDQLAAEIRVVTELDINHLDGFPAAATGGARSEDASDGFAAARKNSLPPKYEDLDQPPKYEEHMFLATPQNNESGAGSTNDIEIPPGSTSGSTSNTNESSNEVPNRNIP